MLALALLEFGWNSAGRKIKPTPRATTKHALIGTAADSVSGMGGQTVSVTTGKTIANETRNFKTKGVKNLHALAADLRRCFVF